jgi:hypothetical protein
MGAGHPDICPKDIMSRLRNLSSMIDRDSARFFPFLASEDDNDDGFPGDGGADGAGWLFKFS